MAVVAGVSTVQIANSVAGVEITSTAPTGVTGTATYQWHRSTSEGFTPVSATELAGQTELDLIDTTVAPNTTYYYVLVVSDDEPSSDSYAEVSAFVEFKTELNSFEQVVGVGQKRLVGTADVVVSAMIDESVSEKVYVGQAMKLVSNADGIPQIAPIAADTDEVFGYVVHENSRSAYSAKEVCEIAQKGGRYLVARGAISAGAQLISVADEVGVLAAATGSSSAKIVGYAYDSAVDGQKFGAVLDVPSFKVDA